jgi:hypothetical protein
VGRKGIIVAAAGSRRGFFQLQLSNWFANRERSGVLGFCCVMVEVSSYAGSYGPSSGRAGRSVCYSDVHRFKTLAL